jgi:molybdopterin synthase catalytic subunit
MAPNFTYLSVTRDPIYPPNLPKGSEWGSVLSFAGIVRGHEDGSPIQGINYTAYEDMARATLTKIANEGREQFAAHGLWIEHRIGFVPTAEPSLFLEIGTPHSKEGSDALSWYLRQVKTKLPIWKEPVPSATQAQLPQE